jgi:hypothetical protein
VAETKHSAPMAINQKQGKERDEVSNADVSEKDVARDVADGEYAKGVPGGRGNMSQVVGDVDGDENGTGEKGDEGEKVAEKAQEAEKRCCVEADFFDQFGLFCSNQRWEPAESRIGYRRRRFGIDVVFDFGFVDDLWKRTMRRLVLKRDGMCLPYFLDAGR